MGDRADFHPLQRRTRFAPARPDPGRAGGEVRWAEWQDAEGSQVNVSFPTYHQFIEPTSNASSWWTDVA